MRNSFRQNFGTTKVLEKQFSPDVGDYEGPGETVFARCGGLRRSLRNSFSQMWGPTEVLEKREEGASRAAAPRAAACGALRADTQHARSAPRHLPSRRLLHARPSARTRSRLHYARQHAPRFARTSSTPAAPTVPAFTMFAARTALRADILRDHCA